MFLKSLEIRGFKSFAEKTELKFKKGITAVVGPNGSGKSNISDSVRWVLGEQSVKTLRGGKMEDVIFAGTQFRKPVGLAQVSLTLDNLDGSLQTEYNEVTVTRRIFRTGETEYLINNQKCRLKDITQLFMDTGIGKEGYSLIGQGKIEAILSGKPEERRSLLEEAAGIVKFKSRKEEAEKKLHNTDENLVRIRDIIFTYEERIEPLRIEKEKALKFKILDDTLKKKEVNLIVHHIQKIEEELENYSKSLDEKKRDLHNKKNQLLDDREKLKEIELKIEEIEKKNSEEKSEYYLKKDSISKSLSDIELFKERIISAKDVISKNEVTIEIIKGKITKLSSEKEKIQEEITKKIQEQKISNDKILKLEEKNFEAIEKIATIENTLKKLKDDEFELFNKNSSIKNEIILITKEIESKDENKENLKVSIISCENNIKINKATLKELELNKEKLKSRIKELEESIISKKRELMALNSKLSTLDNNYKNVAHNITGINANIKVLNDLEEGYEGYNFSVKTLMKNISKGITPKANGTKVLGEIIEIKNEHIIAMDIALGGAIQNVITEDEEIAKGLINYLKTNKLGRVTFLPLNIIRGRKLTVDQRVKGDKGFVGIASEIIGFPERYANIIDYSLGKTIIATNMDSALRIAKMINYSAKIVTLEGEVINSGGALTGGSIKVNKTNILSRKGELKELANNLEMQKNKLQELTKEINDLKNAIRFKDDELISLKEEVHNNQIDITKNNGEIENFKNEYIKLTNSLDISRNELIRIENEGEKARVNLEKCKEELEALEQKKQENKKKSETLESQLVGKREEISDSKELLTNLKVTKASLDEVIISIKNEIERKTSEINEITANVKGIKNENTEKHEAIEILNKNINNKNDKIKELKDRILELDEIFKEEDVEKGKLKEAEKLIDSRVIELVEVINRSEGEVNKREIGKAKFEMERDNHYTKLNEEMDLTYVEALDLAEAIDNIAEVKDDIFNLKKKITSLGIVNLAAIEEFEEVSEKYNFMTTQEQDLERAKEELLSVINEMTGNMKELFKENFKILNENFKETFRDLFKGGNAELILGEGDELSANIDINVEPPGKKLQNINLMSGGEKVLSAIALLFAILKMKPTPFCILDEIEAALDDANVFRYAEFLRRFSEKSQFIVITHRKGTMEACDVLYGVTMEEKGVSKVVSVDMENN
ncbi:MAG: chromosome segregation protein SMC [Clostridium sp.]